MKNILVLGACCFMLLCATQMQAQRNQVITNETYKFDNTDRRGNDNYDHDGRKKHPRDFRNENRKHRHEGHACKHHEGRHDHDGRRERHDGRRGHDEHRENRNDRDHDRRDRDDNRPGRRN